MELHRFYNRNLDGDCLKKAGLKTEAEEFQKKAFAAGSYDEVLRLVMEFVEVV